MISLRRWWVRPLAVFTVARIACVAAQAMAAQIDPIVPVSKVLGSWDSSWYISLAQHGYPKGAPVGPDGRWVPSLHGFFPLYSVLIRLVHDLTRLSYVASAVAVSVTCSLAAAVAIAAYVRRFASDRIATRTVALVGFFPAAHVLTMGYSEGLFLLLAALCLIGLFDGCWWLAGGAGFLAGLTRPTAVALIVACAVPLVAAIRARDRARIAGPLLAVILSIGGLVTFSAVLWARTGYWLAYPRSKAQGWGGQGILQGRYGEILRDPRRDFNLSSSIVMLLLALAVMAWLVIRARRRQPLIPTSALAYAATGLLLACVANTYDAAPRQVLVLFPLAVPLAHVDEDRYVALLGSFAVGMGALVFLARKLYTP